MDYAKVLNMEPGLRVATKITQKWNEVCVLGIFCNRSEFARKAGLILGWIGYCRQPACKLQLSRLERTRDPTLILLS